MAKTIKVRVKREELPGRTHYVYPEGYDAKKVEVLAYEAADERKARGDDYQYCIGVIHDKDAGDFLKSPDIEEITDAKAREMGRRWRLQVTTIQDDQKVIRILSKQARGEKLTQKEKDALDPDKDEPGIGKSQSFDEILDRVKNAKKFN